MTGDAPSLGGFEYEVSIQIWLPLPHAELLRTTALHHYDYIVRESADRGAINGLRNRALARADDVRDGTLYENEVYAFPLRFGDLDIAMKAMEGCRPQTDVEAAMAYQIRAALRDGMAKIIARGNKLAGRTPF